MVVAISLVINPGHISSVSEWAVSIVVSCPSSVGKRMIINRSEPGPPEDISHPIGESNTWCIKISVVKRLIKTAEFVTYVIFQWIIIKELYSPDQPASGDIYLGKKAISLQKDIVIPTYRCINTIYMHPVVIVIMVINDICHTPRNSPILRDASGCNEDLRLTLRDECNAD